MLKKILLIVGLLVVAFVIVVALQPASYRVERTVTIAAPAAEIFPHVNNLKKAAAWNPWLKLDPQVKTTYEGPAEGKGASSTWAGNSDIGEGRQTIIESRPNELVRLRLDFLKPFEDTCTAEVALKPAGGQTQVTWAMFGEKNFVSKAVCLFMDQDKMIGDSFNQGLASLKTIAEPVAKK